MIAHGRRWIRAGLGQCTWVTRTTRHGQKLGAVGFALARALEKIGCGPSRGPLQHGAGPHNAEAGPIGSLLFIPSIFQYSNTF
jgi:hypothetical protein